MTDAVGRQLLAKGPRKDPYEVLGVKEENDNDAIRIAYKHKALECHPDKNPGVNTADLFRAVKEAYTQIKTKGNR
jgi:curved DNA-binding protein CbpA